MKDLKLEDLPKATETIFEKLISLEKINELNHYFQSQKPEALLTRKETAEYLKIDSSTLWSWTKKGKIKCYGISNRRYYKRSDIEDALVLLKQ
ncbi:helix-turn-helix domain-containing protein [Psychroserpens burtonensis]|uniref:Helix-turn-helix domain-containing protein n=1 Tax=Psychroserpens burtonensis TaxID=49278 RepID=A0A5C7B3R6_9FLAO|nr:helix-turn-helix domain-containing protein [Psychroserpens burtonensis]TXE15581.1 helix-turn-helix domain-containing protein [Psychroserpens burtonensis]